MTARQINVYVLISKTNTLQTLHGTYNDIVWRHTIRCYQVLKFPRSEVTKFRERQDPKCEVSGLGERIIDSFNYDNKSVVNMTKKRFFCKYLFLWVF